MAHGAGNTKIVVRTSHTLPILLSIIGTILVLLGFWFFPIQFITQYAADLLSPIGSSTIIHAKNPLYDEVQNKKTVDSFSSFPHFPQSLTPIFTELIDITVRSYAVMDRDIKELLYAKNITEELPIASVTKVMTAIIALENAPIDLEITISSAAASIGEATMGISPGEKYTLSDLLYGTLLPSGNDASETIAEGVGKFRRNIPTGDVDGGGARRWFIDEMNTKAQSLGMYDTYFFNPTGLDEETKETSSFSTALDLLALAHYALENETFAEIVSTRGINLPYEEGKHKALYIGNILQLDRSYPGIKGIKPGNSDFAQETLLSYAERNGRRIIVVILGSSHTKDDVVKVYKKVFGA